MDDVQAIMIIENCCEGNSVKAWSQLIKSGIAFKLGGIYAKMATWMIKTGIITEGGEIVMLNEQNIETEGH